MIYVIRCGDTDLYKIGHTIHEPKHRRTELQSGCPYPLTLIAVYEGDTSTEDEVHSNFSEKHVRGEWYSLTHDDLRRLEDSLIKAETLEEHFGAPAWTANQACHDMSIGYIPVGHISAHYKVSRDRLLSWALLWNMQDSKFFRFIGVAHRWFDEDSPFKSINADTLFEEAV